jgi:dihydropyrimidine dehydrogenase (NAD+) subunit PreA
MSERGMGSAVGQVPEYTEMITSWVKEVAKIPVIVKLTPNVTDVTRIAAAAERGGADAVSLINTINSLIGVDLETFTPRPDVGGKSSHGGYCGPAVKPIALNMIQQVNSDPIDGAPLPMSGIGGIGNWRDAAEFILLGCGTVQVCTAVMHFGYRIVEDMIDGLSNWMDSKGFVTIEDLRGRSLAKVTDWQHLNLNYKIVAHIDESLCIGCQLCHIACWDGAHQCIHLDRVTGAVDGHVEVHAKPREYGRETIAVTPIPRLDPPRSAIGPYATTLDRIPRVDETECVGCNLCSLVCPVDGCITMVERDTGLPPETWAQRIGGVESCEPTLVKE